MIPAYIVIAISGYKRSGKTVLTRKLCTELCKLQHRPSSYSFSDPLKRLYQSVSGRNWNEIGHEQKIIDRPFMTTVGDACLKLDRLCFAKAAIEHIGYEFTYADASDIVIIDDLRFVHEYETLVNWQVTKQYRLVTLFLDGGEVPASTDHQSETGMLQLTNLIQTHVDRNVDVQQLAKQILTGTI